MIPTVTHIQFVVLDILQSGKWVSAHRVRTALKSFGDSRQGPAFYQLMQRMVKDGFIKHEVRLMAVDDCMPVARTYYKILASGLNAWRETIVFYGGFNKDKA